MGPKPHNKLCFGNHFLLSLYLMFQNAHRNTVPDSLRKSRVCNTFQNRVIAWALSIWWTVWGRSMSLMLLLKKKNTEQKAQSMAFIKQAFLMVSRNSPRRDCCSFSKCLRLLSDKTQTPPEASPDWASLASNWLHARNMIPLAIRRFERHNAFPFSATKWVLLETGRKKTCHIKQCSCIVIHVLCGHVIEGTSQYSQKQWLPW